MKHLRYLACLPVGMAVALSIICSQMMHAQTWVSLNGPQIASDVKDISVTTSGNYLYVADASYVLKSTNAGTGWAVTPQPYSSPLLVLVKPNDSTIVHAAMNGALVRSTNGGAGWTTIPDLTNLVPLRLAATPTDNNVMLLGRTWLSGNNSIWRSVNGGSGWEKVTNFTDTTNIRDFAAYPINDPNDADRKKIIWAGGSHPDGASPGSNRVAVAKKRGVWVSNNYGVNWAGSTLGEYDVHSVAIVDKPATANYHLYAACSFSGAHDTLFKSTNIAGAWTPIFNGVGEIRLVRVNRSTSTIFLATNDGVYRSTDASSTNGGGTWSKLTNFPENNVKSIAIGSGSVVFAGTAATLYKSTDNGSNWTNVGDMDVSSVTGAQIGSTQYAYAVTKDINIAARHNGTSWERRTIGAEGTPFSAENIYRHPATGRLFAAGALRDTARLFSSTDNGVSYSPVTYTYSLQSGSRYHAITTGPTGTMYLVGGGTLSSGGSGWRNLFNSLNGGTTWEAIGDIGGAGLWIYDITAPSDSTLYAAASNGNVYQSTNWGMNWSVTTGLGSIARSIAVNPNHNTVVYAGGFGGVKKTTNGGASWSTIRTDNVMRVLMHPSYQNSANHVLAVGSGGGAVFETSTGGANWSHHTGVETPIRTLGADVVGKGNIYTGTAGGVYRTNPPPTIVTGVQSAPSGGHPGISWNASPEADLAAAPYRVYRYYRYCAYYHPNKRCGGPVETTLLTQTSSTSFVDGDWDIICYGCIGAERIAGYYVKAVETGGNESEASTSVEFTVGIDGPILRSIPMDIPEYYALETNYPNPFNPSTTIAYALPEDGHVTVKVLDVLGREIATLVNGQQAAGFKSVQFDATGLASGMYFYRITAGAFTDAKKMIVAK